jgi:DNA-binding HxlR family transcriptional regulator
LVGDKWTMLIVRDLVRGARRTTELLAGLQPISSRTLMDRLRDLEHDALIERRNFGGSPPHVEYVLTERGQLLTPLLDALRETGLSLDCNRCNDRQERLGSFCDSCPHAEHDGSNSTNAPAQSTRRAQTDDSIVLL